MNCRKRRKIVINPDLPFLAFLENGKENHQKNKDFLSLANPQIPGKEGENAEKSKEILRKEKRKEFQKSKERKIRELNCRDIF